MLITHASDHKIEKIEKDHDCPAYKGCLFFGHYGNTYNLTKCNYQYSIDIDPEKIIDIKSLWYIHDHHEASEELKNLCHDIDFSLEDEEEMLEKASHFVEESDFPKKSDEYTAWIIQQYQGIIAHKLGYECARAIDEQGPVFIVYCVGRKMEEEKYEKKI